MSLKVDKPVSFETRLALREPLIFGTGKKILLRVEARGRGHQNDDSEEGEPWRKTV